MRRALTRIGIAVALGGASVAAIANVFATSPIMPVDRSQFLQFNAIGLLERTREIDEIRDKGLGRLPGSAVGVLIGPCSVLTNYHVPYGEELVPSRNRDYRLRFSIGYSASSSFDSVSTVSPIAAGDSEKRDFAVLRDPDCNGLKYGWYRFSPLSREELVKMRARVIVVWIRKTATSISEMSMSGGNVIGMRSDAEDVLFDASTVPGSSGGPVFIIYHGRLLLQGINVGAKTFRPLTGDKASQNDANMFLNADSLNVRDDFVQPVQSDRRDHAEKNPLEQALLLKSDAEPFVHCVSELQHLEKFCD